MKHVLTTATSVRLFSGRVAKISPRTMNTVTGWIVWLTKSEAKALNLKGHSSPLYGFSVDMQGNVERGKCVRR